MENEILFTNFISGISETLGEALRMDETMIKEMVTGRIWRNIIEEPTLVQERCAQYAPRGSRGKFGVMVINLTLGKKNM